MESVTDKVLETMRRGAGLPGEPFPQHRLEALWNTCFDLIQDRRAALARMRDQIGQLRAQRALLSEHRAGLQRNGTEAPDAWTARMEKQYGLTRREAEVALLLAAGRGNAAIASSLGISPHTARHHTQHVLNKLGVHSRAEAGALLRG
jgi:DNA-binding CsgD family transcriptional regulator